MGEMITQVLLRQPEYTLELQKHFDGDGAPHHAYVLHMTGRRPEEGINLLMGKGHEISRRDVHYALYLFQRFHLSHVNA